jgi:hypothetical protein
LAVTTEFERLFHTSTTLFVKKFFLVSVRHRFFTSFSECPLVTCMLLEFRLNKVEVTLGYSFMIYLVQNFVGLNHVPS